MIKKIQEQVYELMKNDQSGHGFDHIERVVRLSQEFAKEEQANIDIVTLIAMLHDVDDYKLYGFEQAKNLTNAKRIMKNANVPLNIQHVVCDALDCIGFSKRMNGKMPTSIEGKIVSDADMCDALGANGIIRAYLYSIINNETFFDRNYFPRNILTYEQYTTTTAGSTVNHIFEKDLKLKDYMLTSAGKTEAKRRHEYVINFLHEYFYENNCEDWIMFLDVYR